jgi:acetoin utilization protein AcuB
MLVKNWMSQPVITADENASMQDAIRLLKEHDIRILPVTRNGRLAGIVTDRDLKRASASDATSLEIHELFYLISKIKLKDIMVRNPVTVPFDYTIEETADLLMTHKISGVPVVSQEDEIIGIITQTDIFRVIIALSGFGKRGIQFGFQLEDRPGAVGEITDVIRKYKGRMVSILSSSEWAPKGYRNVYIRAYGIERSELRGLVDSLREKVILLYMVDHRENMRSVYYN